MALKNWLSKTGTYLQGEEILDEVNPFKKFIEHPKYPLARIYRTSFWQGIKDTFHVLVGSHPKFPSSNNKKGRKGVLDLLIFPLIGRLYLFYARSLWNYCLSSDRDFIEGFISSMLAIALLAIGTPFEIIRNLLGFAITLLLTPIVAVVHAVTYPQSKRYHEEIQKLEGRFLYRTPSYLAPNFAPNIVTLRSALGEEPLKLAIVHNINTYYTKDEGLTIVSWVINFQGRLYVEINAQNIKGIKALLAINMGNILSKESELQQIEQCLEEVEEMRFKTLAWMHRLQKECKDQDESIPPVDLSQFAPQIYSFAGCATNKESENARKQRTSEPPYAEAKGECPDENSSLKLGGV